MIQKQIIQVYEPILKNKQIIHCTYTSKYNETYADFARSKLNCEQRKLDFLVMYCPMTSVKFLFKRFTANKDPNEMPIAYFKIDAYFVSNYNNKQQNIYPGQPQDNQLVKSFTPVDVEYKDDSFVAVNTVNDLLFYLVNSASNYDRTISASYNKTLFYRRYTEFPKEALGELFDDAFNILDEIIFLLDSGTLVYLMLVCYIVPAIPVLFKFIGALEIENILALNMVSCIILLLMMLAQSLYIMKQCWDVRQYSKALLDSKSTINFDQEQYDMVIE